MKSRDAKSVSENKKTIRKLSASFGSRKREVENFEVSTVPNEPDEKMIENAKNDFIASFAVSFDTKAVNKAKESWILYQAFNKAPEYREFWKKYQKELAEIKKIFLDTNKEADMFMKNTDSFEEYEEKFEKKKKELNNLLEVMRDDINSLIRAI